MQRDFDFWIPDKKQYDHIKMRSEVKEHQKKKKEKQKLDKKKQKEEKKQKKTMKIDNESIQQHDEIGGEGVGKDKQGSIAPSQIGDNQIKDNQSGVGAGQSIKKDQNKPKQQTKPKVKVSQGHRIIQNIKEIIGFFRNQISQDEQVKLEQDGIQPQYSYNVQNIDWADPMVARFLSKAELDEIYLNYGDINLGDLVLQFPNPDAELFLPQNRPITFAEAENVFDFILALQNESTSKTQIEHERRAFLVSFLLLDDYVKIMSEKEKHQLELQKIKKQKKMESKLGKMFKNLQANMDADYERNQAKNQLRGAFLEEVKQLVELIRMQEQQQEDNEAQNQLTVGKINQLKTEQQQLLVQSQQQLQQQNENALKQPLEKQQQQQLQKQTQEQQELVIAEEIRVEIPGPQAVKKQSNVNSEVASSQQQDKNINADNKLAGKTIVQNKDAKQRKQEKEEETKDPIIALIKKIKGNNVDRLRKIEKNLYNGGFLQMKKTEDDVDWICMNNRPRDFSTLVRFTIMSRLVRSLNMHTRSFLSLDGLNIYMVLKSTQEGIAQQAEMMGMNKQLEIGYADILSLEPCDKLYRPLRLKNEVREAIKELKKEGKLDPHEKPTDFVQRIESRAFTMFKDVLNKWDEDTLWEHIAQKQFSVDQMIQRMAVTLKIDISGEKTGIMGDTQVLSLDEWKGYYLYLEYLFDLIYRLEHVCAATQNDKLEKERVGKGINCIEQNLGFLYKLILRKAMGDTNEYYYMIKKSNPLTSFSAKKNLLEDMWSRLGFEYPLSPFTDFFSTQTEKGDAIWRQYSINENGLRSKFNNMERVKLTNAMAMRTVDLLRLQTEKYITTVFSLHDQHTALGELKGGYFKVLKQIGLIPDEVTTTTQKKLKSFFKLLEDEAESTDFETQSFLEETRFRWFWPWQVQLDAVRNYLGEKMAMYFNYLSFYTKMLFIMAIMAIIFEIIQDQVNKKEDPTTWGFFNFLFGIIITIWSTVFIEFWKREESIFAIRYGQTDFEQDEQERPSFQGEFIRSITNDRINVEYYPNFKRNLKKGLGLFLSFIIVIVVIICVILIFQLKNQFVEQQTFGTGKTASLSNIIPSVINAIQIVIFNTIYNSLKDFFTNYENHKVLSSYENSLILKVFLFQFCNTFNSLFILAYLSNYFQSLNLCKILNKDGTESEDCFDVLKSQIVTIFIINFVKIFTNMITPYIQYIIRKRGQKRDDKPVVHPFNQIDEYIEDQALLAPYQTNQEVDGSIADYMNLIIQFGFLSLFGLSFPLCYLMAFFSNIVQIQVDKTKLVKIYRRPIPQGCGTLGAWLLILDIISFISIFTNAGLLAYTQKIFDEETERKVFFILVIFFLGLKYLLRVGIPDVPQKAVLIQLRHKNVVDKVAKGFNKQSIKTYVQSLYNNQIGGVSYEDKKPVLEHVLHGPKTTALDQIKKKEEEIITNAEEDSNNLNKKKQQ